MKRRCLCDLVPKGTQIRIQPFPLDSHHETSESVWRARRLWMGPAGTVIECLRHVSADIWKSEWMAFVCAAGLALALHVSCRAAGRKERKRKVYISVETDEHRLLECAWAVVLFYCDAVALDLALCIDLQQGNTCQRQIWKICCHVSYEILRSFDLMQKSSVTNKKSS